MLGIQPSFSDLESIDKDYYKQLLWLKNNQIDGVLELTFQTDLEQFGQTRTVDLKPNGGNIAVTDENKVPSRIPSSCRLLALTIIIDTLFRKNTLSFLLSTY